MPDNDKPVPTIILKVTDLEIFNVELNFECPNKEYARLMLLTAIGTIERLLRDEEALAFGVKMQQGAIAHAAMSKPPRRII